MHKLHSLLCDVQVKHWITSGELSPSVAVDTTVLTAFMSEFESLRGYPVATLATTDELYLIGREVRTARQPEGTGMRPCSAIARHVSPPCMVFAVTHRVISCRLAGFSKLYVWYATHRQKGEAA